MERLLHHLNKTLTVVDLCWPFGSDVVINNLFLLTISLHKLIHSSRFYLVSNSNNFLQVRIRRMFFPDSGKKDLSCIQLSLVNLHCWCYYSCKRLHIYVPLPPDITHPTLRLARPWGKHSVRLSPVSLIGYFKVIVNTYRDSSFNTCWYLNPL